MSTWTFDNSHSSVTFAVKHLMVSTVRGSFQRFTGRLELDPANPELASVQATIETASVDTDWDQRDGHLKSPDFLDVANFPEMTFRSTRVEKTGSETARVHGDLTIRGVTHPVVLEAEIAGFAVGLERERRVALSARTKIDREQWGLTWNVGLEAGGVLVGKEIRIELEIAAVETTAAA